MKTKLTIKNGKSYWQANLGMSGGVWRRKFFPVDPENPDQAQKDALEAIRKAKSDRKSFGNQWADLPPVERVEVMRILDEIKKASLTLRDVWTGYQAGTTAKAPQAKSVELEKTVAEFLSSRKHQGCRPDYLASITWFVEKFAEGRGARQVGEITRQDVDEWLRGMKGGPDHKNTGYRRLKTFFMWMVECGYISADPMRGLKPIKSADKVPKIFTLDECRRLLESSRSDKATMPTIVLGLFCGIRPHEVARIRTSDIRGDMVILESHITKTSQRRIVPLPPNAQAWLKLCKPWVFKPFRKPLDRVCSVVPWSHDVMRHTAASMLLAREQDAAKVALWLGNSPAILFRHYREIVTKEDALKFFDIWPNK